MVSLLKELNNEFRNICPESYLEYNTKKNINYPYLVYSYNAESLENTREGFYIDVDIFHDCGANTLELEELMTKIKKHFEKCRILNESVLLQFDVKARHPIPTGNKDIKRRWIQLYCKVDWR